MRVSYNFVSSILMLIRNAIVSSSHERQINIYRRWWGGGGDGEEDFGEEDFGFATIRFTRSSP